MKINFNKSIQEYKTDKQSNFFKIDNQELLNAYRAYGCEEIVVICTNGACYKPKLKPTVSEPLSMDDFDFIELHTIKGLPLE